MTVSLKVETRELTGKGISRKLRRQGFLPAVLYGKSIENNNLKVSALDVEKVLRTRKGVNTLIDLDVEGKSVQKVLIKDYQGDPITRKLTHVDFWSVDENQNVEVNVLIRLEGKAPGLKHGGIMEQTAYKVRVTAKAGSIPEDIVVDISSLDVGQNIHLSDIQLPEGVTPREGYNPNLVSMAAEKRSAAKGGAEAGAAESSQAAGATPEEAKTEEKKS